MALECSELGPLAAFDAICFSSNADLKETPLRLSEDPFFIWTVCGVNFSMVEDKRLYLLGSFRSVTPVCWYTTEVLVLCSLSHDGAIGCVNSTSASASVKILEFYLKRIGTLGPYVVSLGAHMYLYISVGTLGHFLNCYLSKLRPKANAKKHLQLLRQFSSALLCSLQGPKNPVGPNRSVPLAYLFYLYHFKVCPA